MSSKQNRARREAERQAALRRRRLAWLAGLGVVVAGLVAAAIVTGGGGGNRGDEKEPKDDPPAVACDGEAPPEPDPQQYDAAEEVLEPGTDYRAIVHTSCGDIEMDLLEKEAPKTVNNFVFLAREGFFDGLTWHRVIKDFVIQTGDPDGVNGQPPDGPGYTIPDELPTRADRYVYGTVAMANAGPDTGGSQWFIVVRPSGPAGLDPAYSIFGVATPESKETIDAIAGLPTTGADDAVSASEPLTPVYIESIEIVEA